MNYLIVLLSLFGEAVNSLRLQMKERRNLNMRRLVRGNALSVTLLTIIILISSVSAAELYTISNSQTLFVNAVASKYFTITGYPSSTTAGQSFSGITVTVYNSNGKVATGYNGKVYFTSTDPKATVPYTSQSKYTFTTGSKGDKGVHTFSGFNLASAGSQTITVTDGSISLTTNAIKVNPASPTKIQIAPKTATITAGSTQAYTAAVTDYYGNSWDVTTLTSWSNTAGAGGSWSGNIYTCAKMGTWKITGVLSGLSDSASLTVTPALAISITISPKNANVTSGSSQSYSATATDQFANQWDITSAATWKIDSAALGSWSGNTYSAAKTGTWTVTGSLGNLYDTASLIVTHGTAVQIVTNPTTSSITAGTDQAFTTSAFDSSGNSWDATGSSNYLVDSQAGGYLSANVYTSVNAGTWTVTTASMSLFNVVSLTVTHASPVSISVGPNSASITADTSQAYTATASDGYGNIWDVSNLTAWSVSAGAGGSWTNNLYTSASAGSWITRGTYSGLSDYAYLTVNHSSAITLTVFPKIASITTGSSETFTTTASDAYNNIWDATGSTFWVIDSGAGGSWSGNSYTSVTAGTWTITAIYSGLSGGASLTVNHGAALSIKVNPPLASLMACSTQTFTAIASDSNDNSWDVTNSTNWSIDKAAQGSWTGNIYSSYTAGNWTVTGIYSGMSSTASLTINHAPAASITVGPTSATNIAGSSETFTATASDVYGNTWDVTALTVWTIDSGAGGSLSGNVFTSELSGIWNVTGTFGNLSKSVFLTVNHASATSIQLNPYNSNIAAGSSEAYTTTAIDDYGNTWDVTNAANYSISSGAGGSWTTNVYTPAKIGTWNVTATLANLSATVPLIVNLGSAISIVITPKTQTIQAGSTQTFTATEFDIYGNIQDVTASTAWTIDSGASGSWSGNIYTAINAGNWVVTGVFNGLTAKASLSVNHGSISSITVSPDSASILAGSNQSYIATASDSKGNTWDVTKAVSWLISSDAGGSWAGNVCTASNSGNWTVTAVANGVSGIAQLTVNSIQPLGQFSQVDFYHNGLVGFNDVVYFVDGYIQYYQNGTVNPSCDLNHDGKIDFQDIVIFLNDYNSTLVATYAPAPSPTSSQ